MVKPMLLKSQAVAVRVLCYCALIVMFGFSAGWGTGYDADIIGDQICLECHEEVSDFFNGTAHGRINAGGLEPVISCESCHGPGSRHAAESDTDFIINPARSADPAYDTYCGECHSRVDDGLGFSHVEESEGCFDCHTIHSVNDDLLKVQTPQLCFDCHMDIRAALTMPSHHPVMEGLVGCYDCHQIHGGDVKFASHDEGKELCFSCHTSKQGPFIYEHDPVNEDCSICHNPHGAVADNLLIQAEPMLCMSCHPVQFHTTLTGYDGDFQAPLHPERGGISTLDGFKSAMLTKCTQCHTEVHGSDLPAQSITGPGALTR